MAARYIDADILRNEMEELYEHHLEMKNFGADGAVSDCLYFLDSMPTADVVEVKHGKYVYSSTDDKWHCSECFAERPRNNGDIPYSDIYCCYKCGAIMDGGKAE